MIDQTVAELLGENERLRARLDELAMAAAYAEAYRPEVVAEVAVHLSEESDWEAIAAWCSGTIRSSGLPSGDYVSYIDLPGGDSACEGSWITLDHHGVFRVRAVLDPPSALSDTVSVVQRLTLLTAEQGEKLDYLARGCLNLSRDDLIQRITAVGTQQWKAGSWSDQLTKPLRDRITQLLRDQDERADLARWWVTADRLSEHWHDCPAPPDAGCAECHTYAQAHFALKAAFAPGAIGTVDPTPPSDGDPG